jgi:hypothetical protein
VDCRFFLGVLSGFAYGCVRIYLQSSLACNLCIDFFLIVALRRALVRLSRGRTSPKSIVLMMMRKVHTPSSLLSCDNRSPPRQTPKDIRITAQIITTRTYEYTSILQSHAVGSSRLCQLACRLTPTRSPSTARRAHTHARALTNRTPKPPNKRSNLDS